METDPAIVAHRKGHRVVMTREGTKEPIHRRYFERETDETEIGWWRRRNANWAFLLLGLLIADKDARGRAADLFVRRMGLFYSPMAVRTRRGVHYFARWPEGVVGRSRIQFRGMALDLFTGPTRLAIGPGSVVAGHRYALLPKKEIVGPSELPLARPALVELLVDRPEERRGSIPTAFELPDECARRYVDRLPRSELGKNGSRTLFVACLKILSLTGGDLARAWELVKYFNRSKCDPPWDEEIGTGPDSLRRKLNEARKVWNPQRGKERS